MTFPIPTGRLVKEYEAHYNNQIILNQEKMAELWYPIVKLTVITYIAMQDGCTQEDAEIQYALGRRK